MSQMMIQAAVTMGQLQNKLDNISHNMANSQTTGYKSRQSEFSSLLFREINNLSAPENAEGRLTPDAIRTGTGARLGGVHLDLAEGSIQETDRALDVALLDKDHLFQVQTTVDGREEVRYTRDGAFYLSPVNDNTSLLVNGEGDPILGTNGLIQVPANLDDVNINDSGQVIGIQNGEEQVLGQLAIVKAERPRLLEAAGDNMFRLPDEANVEAADVFTPVANAGNTKVLETSALEQSNVDLSEQMTDMVNAQRSYEFNARTLTMGDQMNGLINQLR